MKPRLCPRPKVLLFSIPTWLTTKGHRSPLDSDAFSVDSIGRNWSSGRPVQETGANFGHRGLCACEINVKLAGTDNWWAPTSDVPGFLGHLARKCSRRSETSCKDSPPVSLYGSGTYATSFLLGLPFG